MRKTVDLIPEHVASRIVAINEQLNLAPHVLPPCDRERLAREQTRLWDEYFPGKPYEQVAALVKPFLLAA